MVPRRPDGTVKFAENPPKRYEDIVNFDLESEDWQLLWNALADVVDFWIDHGVRVFRVDNPHTKPLPFWSGCSPTPGANTPRSSSWPRRSPRRP